MKWNGMEWNEMKWNGMKWNEMLMNKGLLDQKVFVAQAIDLIVKLNPHYPDLIHSGLLVGISKLQHLECLPGSAQQQ